MDTELLGFAAAAHHRRLRAAGHQDHQVAQYARDLADGMYLVFTVGTALWLLYGVCSDHGR